MIKIVLTRLNQAIIYCLVNSIILLRLSKKIYLPGYSSPINLRPKTTDLLTFHQIFTFKEYGMYLKEEPKLIIDAGANIGLASLYFNNRFTKAKIIAIEPERSNFEMLAINCKNCSKIVLLRRALSNESNSILNLVDKGYGNWGFVTEISDDSGTQNVVDKVKTITIDEIIKENNIEFIDILKIDIEGSEKELFESNYEIWLPKTKLIIIELHDGIKMGSSKSFFKAISQYNFYYHNRGENLVFINKDIL